MSFAKENVLPNIPQQKRLSDIKSDQENIESQRLRYEEAIKRYTGVDLQNAWLRYFEWTDKTFKSNLAQYRQRMGSLCERFSAVNQDIKVWLKLCESYSSLAEDIFVMLHSKPLAAEKPFIFFSAWLMVLGQSGKAQDCERVFQTGLPKMPQNMTEKFVQKYKEIQQRHNLQIPAQPQVAAPVQRNPLAPRQDPVLGPQQKPLQQSNPLISSTGSDMSLSIQMPSFPNMAMNTQQQQQAPRQHQPAAQVPVAVPSMQSFSQPQMQVPQPAPSKAPMLSRTVSTIVRVGSNRIRRFDDGRLEQIQYSDEMVYPQENEEFCFEEIRAGIVGYRQRWQNGDKIPAKIWLKPKPKPQKQVAQPKQEPKQQVNNVPKPVQPQPVQQVQQIQPVVPSMASFVNPIEQPLKPQKLTFDDAHMSEVKSNLSDNLSGLVQAPGSVAKTQAKQPLQDKENMTPVMPMQTKAKTPLGTVFVAQDKENMPAAPVREEKKMSESFGEEATEYLTVHTREAYHDVMNMFNTFLPSAKSATKQMEEDDGYNSVNSTQANETTTIVVPIAKPVQNFEIFEDPMMTEEQPSGVAVFNAGALQAWTKPKEQVTIFEDKENAPVANTRKSLGSNARVSFVQPMDLSSNANQSQDGDEEDEDEEAAAKRSRFRKRDSIGLYQDRKKSKLTFANAPDYVTFIPEEPFEDENNDEARYNNNLSNSSSSVGTSFNVSPQTRKNTIMNMGSLASSSKSTGTASSSNMSINSTSTQPFQMIYNGAPVHTPSHLADRGQQQHHQQMVHSTQNNQSLDGSVFFDIDDEDVDFNVFELTESNINAAVSNANPVTVATIPVPQQPSLKNNRSSGVHGMNTMMANSKSALDSSVNSSIGGLNNMSGIGGQLLNTSFTASTGPLSHIHQIAPPTQSNNPSSQTASTATSQGLSHPGPNGTTMTVKQQARSKRLSTTNDFTFDLDISQGSNINTADLSSILHNNTIMTQNLNLLANYNNNEVNNVSFVGIPTPQLSSGANNIVDLYHPATLSVAAEYNEAVMNASLCMDPKVADKRSEEIGSLETLFNAPNVDGITLQLDNVTVLRLSSRLYVENGEGYFVAQNVAESSADPQKVFMLKIQSPPCPWEFYVARKIQERTFGDAKLQSLFAPYHLAYVYKNCSFVLLNYPEFGSLKTLRDLYGAKNTSPDEGIIVYYAIEAVRIIETLHSYGIVHCNFNANNLFIKNQACDRWDNLYRPDAAGWENKGLQLAHHLRSIDTQCFAPGVAYDVSALVASCEQNVYYQRNPNSAVGLDYFGLADIVHYILHGKPIEIQVDAKNRIKIRTPIKRFFDVALWEKFFDTVLNTDVNRMNLQDSVACLQQVRRSLEEYFTQGPQAAFRSKTVKLNLEKQFQNILFN